MGTKEYECLEILSYFFYLFEYVSILFCSESVLISDCYFLCCFVLSEQFIPLYCCAKFNFSSMGSIMLHLILSSNVDGEFFCKGNLDSHININNTKRQERKNTLKSDNISLENRLIGVYSRAFSQHPQMSIRKHADYDYDIDILYK